MVKRSVPKTYPGLPTLKDVEEDILSAREAFKDVEQQEFKKEKEAAEKEQKRLEKENKMKKALDLKVWKQFDIKGYILRRSCPMKCPFKSEMTHLEHELYLKAFLTYR